MKSKHDEQKKKHVELHLEREIIHKSKKDALWHKELNCTTEHYDNPVYHKHYSRAQ